MCYAMESMSKNTLIDLVTDIARREVGEDSSDAELLMWIARQVQPVCIARKQAQPNLVGRAVSCVVNDTRYRKEHGIK